MTIIQPFCCRNWWEISNLRVLRHFEQDLGCELFGLQTRPLPRIPRKPRLQTGLPENLLPGPSIVCSYLRQQKTGKTALSHDQPVPADSDAFEVQDGFGNAHDRNLEMHPLELILGEGGKTGITKRSVQ